MQCTKNLLKCMHPLNESSCKDKVNASHATQIILIKYVYIEYIDIILIIAKRN